MPFPVGIIGFNTCLFYPSGARQAVAERDETVIRQKIGEVQTAVEIKFAQPHGITRARGCLCSRGQ